MYRITLLFVGFILFSACKSNKKASVDHEHETHTGVPAIVTFLDSLDASTAIVKDDTDSLFSKINAAEIQIQMKQNFDGVSEDEMRKKYAQFMKTQVSDWSNDEKMAMVKLFEEVKEMCDAVSPRIFPGGIRLIKGKTQAYGNDAFFTRGHNIFVPESIFSAKDSDRWKPVILHEVFHIISRYNTQVREDLYRFIGFVKMDKPVIINDLLKVMVLCNPDGMSVQYATEVQSGDKSIYVVPFITSKHGKYHTDKPSYFDYLNFDIYKLGDYGDHYKIQCDPLGKSLVPLSSTPGYFDNIKNNTQYIIHPDEIMADNFMLALIAFQTKDYSKFTPVGKQLIDQVTNRLQQM